MRRYRRGADYAWATAVLSYDPYAHDQGVPVRVDVLSDEIVTARLPGLCGLCGGPVVPGTRVRAEVARLAGTRTLRHRRMCHACCQAMAAQTTADQAGGVT